MTNEDLDQIAEKTAVHVDKLIIQARRESEAVLRKHGATPQEMQDGMRLVERMLQKAKSSTVEKIRAHYACSGERVLN